MTKEEYAKYEKRVKETLEGLKYISTGACPGCNECLECDNPDNPSLEWYDLANEPHFSWRSCEICGSGLGGSRYPSHAVDKDGNIIHFDVCADCYYYIEYGMGMANIDYSMGIRYGVIPVSEVLQAWCDSSEAHYSCDDCPGWDLAQTDEDGKWFVVDYDNQDRGGPFETEDEAREWAEENKADLCGCDCCEPASWYVDDKEYQAECTDNIDIFITKSPYYTVCQFCSPCAPGAGYVLDACEDGVRTYCFGHDWFEDGKAPYPVYRVEDDTLVKGKDDD